MATSPIDWTGCLSNTGLNVVPPSGDFQTPPLAAPMKTVVLPSAMFRAATAAMRPLIVAEPMLRAPSPEITEAPKTAGLGEPARAGAAPVSGVHDGPKTAPTAVRRTIAATLAEARGDA